MNTKIFFILIILTLSFLTISHSRKIHLVNDDCDKWERGLNGITKLLPNDARLNYTLIGLPGEANNWVRLVLAPRITTISYIPSDTLLTIGQQIGYDTTYKGLMNNRNIIYTHISDSLYYILSTVRK